MDHLLFEPRHLSEAGDVEIVGQQGGAGKVLERHGRSLEGSFAQQPALHMLKSASQSASPPPSCRRCSMRTYPHTQGRSTATVQVLEAENATRDVDAQLGYVAEMFRIATLGALIFGTALLFGAAAKKRNRPVATTVPSLTVRTHPRAASIRTPIVSETRAATTSAELGLAVC